MTRVKAPQKTNFNLSLGQTRQKFHESNDGDEFFLPPKLTYTDHPAGRPQGEQKNGNFSVFLRDSCIHRLVLCPVNMLMDPYQKIEKSLST